MYIRVNLFYPWGAPGPRVLVFFAPLCLGCSPFILQAEELGGGPTQDAFCLGRGDEGQPFPDQTQFVGQGEPVVTGALPAGIARAPQGAFHIYTSPDTTSTFTQHVRRLVYAAVGFSRHSLGDMHHLLAGRTQPTMTIYPANGALPLAPRQGEGGGGGGLLHPHPADLAQGRESPISLPPGAGRGHWPGPADRADRSGPSGITRWPCPRVHCGKAEQMSSAPDAGRDGRRLL